MESSYLNLVVKRILNNFKRKRKFSEELANERIDGIQNLRKEIDFNNLIYYFKGKSNPKFFICFNPIWTGLFWKCLELGGGLVGQRWKNMLYIRKFLFVLHEILYMLYWQNGISFDKKFGKCHFCHQLMTSSWKPCVDIFKFF